jgi:hypothetical protein
MATDRPENRARRALLKRLGLASAMAYVAPALTPLGTARASSSGGGSGPSGGGGGGGGRGGGSRDAPRRVVRQPRRAAAPAPAAPPPPPPELVALVPPGLPREAVIAAGYRILSERPGVLGSDLMRLSLPAGRTPDEAVAELAALWPGATADLNHLYVPDEFLCRDGLCEAHVMVGWSGWPSALAPRIGMIDTGINFDHAALAGQKLRVVQAQLNDRDAAGRQHGTAIAALLIGRLDSPAPGLLPYAELVAVEAFHRGGGGEVADAFALADALQQLMDAQVQVANLSFSGPENGVFGLVMAEALARGIGLVAAAGNGGPGAPPAYPAAWPGVVAVTAVDARMQPYRQAARGAHVAFAAPGVNLWTAASISGGRLRSGTSYAAPFVTAALAVERLRRPDLGLEEVVAGLAACAQDQGDAGRDEIFGHGIVSSPNQCVAPEIPVMDSDFRLSGE